MIPALINLIVWLAVIAILLTLVFWILPQIELPEPVGRILRIVIVVVVVLVIVLLLLQIVGGGGVNLPRLT